MDALETRIRRWAEDTWSFLPRLSTDPRCPDEVRQEAKRWVLAVEPLGDRGAPAWWFEVPEDLP
jgi:hypothetical protein